MKSLYILFVVFILASFACNNRKPSEELLNKKASIPASFKFDRSLKVITSSFNRKNKTMSTLYGNDLALQTAIAGNISYPAGENFTLVTWKQQEDDRWFGARIPGDLLSVEVIKTTGAGHAAISYQKFEGNDLSITSDTLHQQERIKYILAQKPSIMP